MSSIRLVLLNLIRNDVILQFYVENLETLYTFFHLMKTFITKLGFLITKYKYLLL